MNRKNLISVIAVGLINFVLAVLSLLLCYYAVPQLPTSFSGIGRYSLWILVAIVMILLALASRKIALRLLSSRKQVFIASLISLGLIGALYAIYYSIELAPLFARKNYCNGLRGDAPDDCYTLTESYRVVIIYYMALGYLIFVTVLDTIVSSISLYRKSKLI